MADKSKVIIIPTSNFAKEAKKLLKKYPSLKQELIELKSQIENNPRTGTELPRKAYKIRLGVKSKGRGKSGGLRVITYVVSLIKVENETTEVYLLSIYDKAQMNSISNLWIKYLIEEIIKF